MGIKDNIPYTYMSKTNIRGKKDHITESQTIEIPTTNKQKIRITNVYVPPHNSQAAKNASGGEGSVVRSEGPNGSRSGRSRSNKTSSNKRNSTGNRGGRSTGTRTIRTTRRSAGNSNRRGTRNANADVNQESNNTNARDVFFDPSRWPAREFDMICGDVNAHSILWDDTRANKEPDQRGITLEN